jgi:hypothetical protein
MYRTNDFCSGFKLPVTDKLQLFECMGSAKFQGERKYDQSLITRPGMTKSLASTSWSFSVPELSLAFYDKTCIHPENYYTITCPQTFLNLNALSPKEWTSEQRYYASRAC